MALKLKDMIYSAWIIMISEEEARVVAANFKNAVLEFRFSEEELRVMMTNFRDAVLAFQEEELK